MSTSLTEEMTTARAENHRKGLLSTLHAHTKLPHGTDLLWETIRTLNRPWRARTEEADDDAGAQGEQGLQAAGRRPHRSENGVRMAQNM